MCNMMSDPVFKIFSFASPKVITPSYTSCKVPQTAYIFCIFVFQLSFQLFHSRWDFPNELVRVEGEITLFVIVGVYRVM